MIKNTVTARIKCEVHSLSYEENVYIIYTEHEETHHMLKGLVWDLVDPNIQTLSIVYVRSEVVLDEEEG